MEGALIAFRLARYDKDRASGRVKCVVGPRTSSHVGRYVVRRRGRLDDVPHVRLIRGVVIVRTEDVGRVMSFLEGLGAEVHVRTVALTKEDREILRASRSVRGSA